MKKKKRRFRLKFRTPIEELDRPLAGSNMPKVKPAFKEKFSRKHLAKLYKAIKVFIRGISKKRKEIRDLSKIPVSEINIRFDHPDIVLFKKKRKKTKRIFKSGNIEIENDQILGAHVYDVKVNPKGTLGKEILLTKKEKRDAKKRKREEENGETKRVRQKRKKKGTKRSSKRKKERDSGEEE